MTTTKDKMEFAFHMARHSSMNPYQIQRLMRYGATLNRLAVKQCNEPWTDADQRKRDNVKKAVLEVLSHTPGTGAVFSNDHRGACLKITVEDGFTNDWGKEGICVPTS